LSTAALSPHISIVKEVANLNMIALLTRIANYPIGILWSSQTTANHVIARNESPSDAAICFAPETNNHVIARNESPSDAAIWAHASPPVPILWAGSGTSTRTSTSTSTRGKSTQGADTAVAAGAPWRICSLSASRCFS
jgi:hypothetical protein